MSKYSEDKAVEQPAIELFEELGWETIHASDEVPTSGGPGEDTGQRTDAINRVPTVPIGCK